MQRLNDQFIDRITG